MTKRRNVGWSRPQVCSAFVTGLTFRCGAVESVKDFLATEGTMAPKDCPRCGGTGYVARPADISGKSEGVAFIRVKCPACAGSGRIEPLPPSTAKLTARPCGAMRKRIARAWVVSLPWS